MTKSKNRDAFPADIQGFINTFADELASGTAAIFAGAGLSAPAGYVNWAELLRGLANELGLDVDRESNLVALAQYHLNEHQNRTRINQAIIDQFGAKTEVTENHRILVRLPIATWWTTNYDRLIETALEDENRVVDVKHTVTQFRSSPRQRDAVLYKMHGDVSDADNAVVTKDDYEGYFQVRELFVTALAGDLVSKTFLFLGFSFTDPNIEYILSRIRVKIPRKQPKQHYCILRQVERKKKESLKEFEYRRLQQSFLIKDLKRFGIQVLLIQDYKDITRILRAIERRYRSRTIIVCGAASEFSDPWTLDRASTFLESLAGHMIKAGLNVLSGFGRGVGPAVISGCLQEIHAHPRKRLASQLRTMPFPVTVKDPEKQRALYKTHRERIMGQAGIAVFVFGNKRDNQSLIVPSSGMDEELAIAKAQGVHVIAVGATGWKAAEFSKTLAITAAQRSSAYRVAFGVANDAKSSNQAIVTAVLDMIDIVRAEPLS